MASSGANKPTSSVAEQIDRFFFIKRGHSIFAHFVPFAIAALLLVVSSLPPDNLLLKLAAKLDAPGIIAIPAGILTIVAFLVYLASMRATIRQAYLWPKKEMLRAIITAAVYAFICTIMACVVLYVSSPQPWTWGRTFACLLLALLSLTGLGWSLPSTWVDSIGVTLPDYTAGRQAAEHLVKVIRRVREQTTAANLTTVTDCEEALKAAKDLLDNIETNLPLEAIWAKDKLEKAQLSLQSLARELDKTFVNGDKATQENFGAASKCTKSDVYPEYTKALSELGKAWPELLC